MTAIYAIHRAPPEAPERFATIRWACAPGARPLPGEPIFAATVELARVAIPAGYVRRAAPGVTAAGARRRRPQQPKPAAALWLPGPFSEAVAPPPAAAHQPPPAPRARPRDDDSIVEVWEVAR